MKWMLMAVAAAAVLAGCGGAAEKRSAAAKPAAKREAPDLIVFRRVRFEGATMNILHVRADGSMRLDVPNGGAGGANFESKLKPATLLRVRRALATTPWDSLTKRRVLYDRSGAYFMLHHAGQDYVAMADGMSADLLPVVKRLNDVLNGEGLMYEKRAVHRFGRV